LAPITAWQGTDGDGVVNGFAWPTARKPSGFPLAGDIRSGIRAGPSERDAGEREPAFLLKLGADQIECSEKFADRL